MSLVGTPFVHQQRTPGVGMDCLGAMVLPPNMNGLYFEDYRAYGRVPNPRQMVREVSARMDLVRVVHDPEGLVSHLRARDVEPAPGDVGLCWLNPALAGLPHHAFMLVPGPAGRTDAWMVHAWMEAGRTVYNPYAEPWTSGTHSFWRYRGLEV